MQLGFQITKNHTASVLVHGQQLYKNCAHVTCQTLIKRYSIISSIMLSRLGRWSFGLLVFVNMLIPLALIIFAQGFFPYKPFLSGRSIFNQNEEGIARTAQFDRVIFMVVDALRRWSHPGSSGICRG